MTSRAGRRTRVGRGCEAPRRGRGAAPTTEGYASLAANGVTRVVDLRAEDGIDVNRFLEAVRTTDGIVFVHCGAGVGRTGTLAAAWLVASGQAAPREALRRNLSVGPPSLEQLAWVARLGDGDADDFGRPNPAIVALSRTLDAPRRLWSRYGG